MVFNEIKRVAPGTKTPPDVMGLELPDDLDFETWVKIGKLLKALPGSRSDDAIRK